MGVRQALCHLPIAPVPGHTQIPYLAIIHWALFGLTLKDSGGLKVEKVSPAERVGRDHHSLGDRLDLRPAVR